MDVVIIVLLFIGLILFFGSFAEFIFRRFGLPDVLFLILLGFILGPSVLGYVDPSYVDLIAPIFTTFTLLFLLFDGAFNINLSSLIKGFSGSMKLTLWNFFVSAIVITLLMMLFGFDFPIALLAGFALGGVSSSFVIPVLQQMNLSSKTFSLLALESALTDVFSIVFSLAVIEFIQLGGFAVQSTLTQIVSLFAVGAVMGLVAGVWFLLVVKVFREHNYMLTIAYLLILFVVTEFLHGSGAIAALFFGLMLNNSRVISSIIKGITSTDATEKSKAMHGDLGISITTRSEEFFYKQISFFLKTFFFVYIGILIDISNVWHILVGVVISIAVMYSRLSSNILKSIVDEGNKAIVDSMFARGLAAAAIAQIAIQQGVPGAEDLASIAYIVITGTIILASLKIFWKRHKDEKEGVLVGSNGKKGAVTGGAKKKKGSSAKKAPKRKKSKKKSNSKKKK